MTKSIDYFIEKNIDRYLAIKILNDFIDDGVASAESPNDSAKIFLMHHTYDIGFKSSVALCWNENHTIVNETAVAVHLARTLETKIIFEPTDNNFPKQYEWHLVDQGGDHYAANVREFDAGIELIEETIIPYRYI